MKKAKRTIKIIAIITVASLLVLSITGLVLWRAKGIRVYSIQSGSMEPTLKHHDLALVQKTPISSIRSGDIVTYFNPNINLVVTHRVVKIDKTKGTMVTKGDNASQPDWPVPITTIIGKTVYSVPKIGYIVDTVRRPALLIAGIYVPAVLIIIMEIFRLARSYTNRPYKFARRT